MPRSVTNIDLDHDKIAGLFDYSETMKSSLVELPAGGAPSRLEIDHHRLLHPCGFFENIV
jgi:hypothetical protein